MYRTAMAQFKLFIHTIKSTSFKILKHKKFDRLSFKLILKNQVYYKFTSPQHLKYLVIFFKKYMHIIRMKTK